MWIAVRTSLPTPVIVYSRIPEPWNVWASTGRCSGSIHNGTAERAIVDPVDTEQNTGLGEELGFVFSSFSSWRMDTRRIRMGTKNKKEKEKNLTRKKTRKDSPLSLPTHETTRTNSPSRSEDMVHWVLDQRAAFSQISPA